MSRKLYNNPKAEKLLFTLENQNFEKKTALVQPKGLSTYFSAFANSSVEGGLIVIGIEKNKKLTGINLVGQEKINRLLQAQYTFCPSAKVAHKEVGVINDKGHKDRMLLFYVEFSPDKVVKLISGEAYERIGDQTIKMSPEKIRQMGYDKREADFEKESIPTLTTEKLNTTLMETFITKWVERDGLTKRPTVEDLILMKGFGQREHDTLKINHAGALLFHDHPDEFIPGAKIRFLKYEGTKIETGPRSNIIKDRYFDGPVTSQIDELAEMVRTQIREFSFLGADGKFRTVLEYPEFAWYEGVVNAVAHRAYNLKNANIFVRMFNDRIEVESPGNLPSIVTVENIYRESFPRNPTLMQALLYLGYVKFASEGVDRMRDEMINLELPEPKFQNDKSAVLFKVVLRNNIEKRAVKDRLEGLEELNQDVIGDLRDKEKKIIYYLVQNKKGQISDFQKEIRRSRSTTIDYVRSLEKKRLVRRRGKLGPKVDYILADLVFDMTNAKSRTEKPRQEELF